MVFDPCRLPLAGAFEDRERGGMFVFFCRFFNRSGKMPP